MNKIIFFGLAALIILVLVSSCKKDNPVPPEEQPQINLTLEDLSSIETWIRLSTNNLTIPAKVEQFKDNSLNRIINLSAAGSILYIVPLHLKQYDSKWADSSKNHQKSILASNNSLTRLDVNDLTVELACDNTNIIQGKPFNIIAKVHNNTNKPIEIDAPIHYLFDFSKDSIYTNQYGAGRFGIQIPPQGNYSQFYDPQDYLVYNGIDFSSHTLYPSTYEYHISYFLGKDEFLSNTLRLNILPVPDSLQTVFDKLKYIPGKPHSMEDFENFYKDYKDSFYGAEFMYKLLRTFKFIDAIRNIDALEYREEALKLNQEFINRYPDTKYAYTLLQTLILSYSDNKILVEEIIKTLQREKPECKLLEILKNQPSYLNKKINYLLN